MSWDSIQDYVNFYLIKKEILNLKNSISFILTDFLTIRWLVIGQLS